MRPEVGPDAGNVIALADSIPGQEPRCWDGDCRSKYNLEWHEPSPGYYECAQCKKDRLDAPANQLRWALQVRHAAISEGIMLAALELCDICRGGVNPFMDGEGYYHPPTRAHAILLGMSPVPCVADKLWRKMAKVQAEVL